MNHEKIFQEKLIADIEGLGGSAIHLEPAGHSGFPDLLVTYLDRYKLVELKSVENAHRQKFGSLFEVGQLSWHSTWGRTHSPVITLIEVRSKRQVIEFIAHTPAQFLEYYDATLASLYNEFPLTHVDSIASVLIQEMKV